MNLNLTLVGQVITFILFVWFTMKFVWPPLLAVMDERRKQVADGLAAAQQGKDELELAQHKSKDLIAEAKTQAGSIVEQAHQRANHIIEEAKHDAREEGDRLLHLAQNDIQQEVNQAREQLISQVATLAVAGAEKILKEEVKAGSDRLVNDAIGELNG